MSFKYPHTCPAIDKEIHAARSAIYSFLKDLLEEACPLLGRAKLNDLSDTYTDSLYDKLESAFETVRKTNEDMRSEAESQIDDLKDALAEANAAVKHLERRIEEATP